MRSACSLNIAVKASLVLLLAFGAFSGLERFAGKAFGWRLIGYSVAALIVPAIWAARGRRSTYPYATAALARTHIRGAELFGLVVGFGGVTAILWEIGEYFAFIRNSSELATAYTDTLGDMALGLSGSTLTATIAVVVLHGRSTSGQ